MRVNTYTHTHIYIYTGKKILETRIFRHNGAPIQGPLKPLNQLKLTQERLIHKAGPIIDFRLYNDFIIHILWGKYRY